MKEPLSQKMALFVQFAIAVIIGGIFLMNADGETAKTKLFGSLTVGVFGSWILTKLYVWIRHGKDAAKSMRWFGN